ncbi:MBL fold metallo-hydrolase [bacterium]|nr:MBL fold metallo-hydrolase [bacterium]NIN92765.1 MBL fold metallo-hydrolase [bacterium]NIO18746.1 MBL fold metallo-hydrolase [bacterium]NIO73822.1 MBL fold metallo-hydrolase [bacterium]
MKKKESKANRIIFLGTGGARVVVFKQIRASGGTWFSIDGTEFLLDPGPGALIRCLQKGLKPKSLEGIILSHRHLDHSADINVMIEAMTEGGFSKKGVVFAPGDALQEDPVIFRYVRNYLEKVEILKVGKKYEIGNISFEPPVKHIHGNTETYGFNFHTSRCEISYLSDTRFFPRLTAHYKSDLLIVNVVRLQPSNLDHLCMEDFKKIVKECKPRVAILTHFGMTLLRANPWKQAKSIEDTTGVKVVVAKDGMVFDTDKMEVSS